MFFTILSSYPPHLTSPIYRKLEAEADEKLQNVYQQLLQAGVDRNESEREVRLKETLTSLQRLFPGEMLIHLL